MNGLSQLRCLSLSENDLFVCQDEVLAANRAQLSPIGLFKATLTLGEASVDTTISVFPGVDDALLSWYDSRALHIIPDGYPKRISAVHSTATGEKRIAMPFWRSSQTSWWILCVANHHDGTLMQIQLCLDAKHFGRHTPNGIPLAWWTNTKAMLESMVEQEIVKLVGDEVSEWCHPVVVAQKQ